MYVWYDTNIGQKCGVFSLFAFIWRWSGFSWLYTSLLKLVRGSKKKKKGCVRDVFILRLYYKGSISPHSRHCCDGVCLLGSVSSPLKKKEIRKKELTRKINIIVNKYEVLYLPHTYICIRDQNACVQVYIVIYRSEIIVFCYGIS